VLISPTDNMGKVLASLNDLPYSPGIELTTALNVCMLALKHRRNKNGAQRLIVFVGSPISCDEKAITKTGKALKKSNIGVDIVLMGEHDHNEGLLKVLVEATNKNENSHLVTVPSGVLPSDVLLSSPIMNPDGASGGGGGGGGGGAFDGMDDDMRMALQASMAGGAAPAPAAGGGGGGGGDDLGMDFAGMDPELAMALRISMEEEKARVERVAKSEAEAAGGTDAAAATSSDAPAAEEPMPDSGFGNYATTFQGDGDDDAAMQLALAMSMAEGNDAGGGDDNMQMESEFVNELIGTLPGVDPNDPRVQDAMKDDDDDDDKDEAKNGGGGDGKKE
jgi:26S proteasome regulatory subunit N10